MSSDVLDYMRNQLATLRTDTCQVIRITEAPDGFGGTTETASIIATYTCRVSSLGVSSSERVAEPGALTYQSFFITLPWDADVELTDMINVTGGSVYEVLGVDKGKTNPLQIRVSVAVISG